GLPADGSGTSGSSQDLDASGIGLAQWLAWRAANEMAHAGDLVRICQKLPDPGLQRAFVFGHPFVLAQVLHPRAVEEVLQVGALGFGVFGNAPLHRAIAATAAAETTHRAQELFPAIQRDPVLDRDQ